MKTLILAICLALGVAGTTAVRGEESSDRMFDRAAVGVYLLTQTDGPLRLLTLDRGGTASQVSPQQTTLGFTAGQGAWGRTGHTEVTARIVDFDFDPLDGKPAGATVIHYVVTLSDLELSGFQRVTGRYAGKQYALGQDPLDPNAKPVRSFGVDFTGRRVRAPVRK